jgi:hypothetical protein
MPTANYYIGVEDGWTEVAPANDFVRVSGHPYTHPYYVYAGASAPSATAVQGTGTVTFSVGLPVADETVTVGGEVFTFKATRTVAFEVAIGADFTATAQNFKAAVNLDSTKASASGAGAVITLTSYVGGTAGNITLTEAATNVAVSGATLTGGTDVTVGVLVCRQPFEVNVTMTEKLFVRVPVPVANASQNNGKLRLDVFTIV